MMYSIIPSEVIFAQPPQAALPEMLQASVGGLSVLARRHADGSCRVERILSTNPRDFLQPNILGQNIPPESCNQTENTI